MGHLTKINGDSDVLSTRERILEAAGEEFFSKGFAGARTVEIARLAGVNHAMVHYYFQTKENLFSAFFEKKFGLFMDGFSQIVDAAMPLEDKIRAKMEIDFQIMFANPRWPFLMINEANTHPERFKRFTQGMSLIPMEILDRFQVELDAEATKGTIRPVRAFDLFLNILSLNAFMFLSIPVAEVFGGISPDTLSEFLHHRRDEAIELIIRGLKL